MEPTNETNQPEVLGKQNLFDGIIATCAVGGAIAAATTQSVALAAFPLAGAIGLHLFNRRQLMAAMTNRYETMIRQQNLYIVNHQNSLNSLSERLQQLSEEMNGRFERLSIETIEHAERLTELQKVTEVLTDSADQLNSHHQKLVLVVENLQQIENSSHILQIKPDSAEIYCQRAINFQKLGDTTGAIADVTQAIQLDPQYAEAYHQRGLLHAELGNRQAAVDDLREAAKFYFELGDIERYQTAKDLAGELYDREVAEIRPQAEEARFEPIFSEQVLVGGLFDD